MQMIGRATRPQPGVVDGPETAVERRQAIVSSDKPHCIVIDFVGNSGRHKLVSLVDVLAGKDVDPVDLETALAEAKGIAAPVDMDDLIEKANQSRKLRITATHRADSGRYTAEDVDLFQGRKFDAFSDYQPTASWAATQKQVNLLLKLGVQPETATRYSKHKAYSVIDKLLNRTGGDYIVTLKKHAGKPLRDVPAGYIDWALDVGAGGDRLRQNVELMRQKCGAV
jgi:type I site-specific restriction endonuclease